MIKELMHDPIFLAGKSEKATKDDISVAQDLLDTLMAHREGCVGMAANMIGVRKCIIACNDVEGVFVVIVFPEFNIIDTDTGFCAKIGLVFAYVNVTVRINKNGIVDIKIVTYGYIRTIRQIFS